HLALERGREVGCGAVQIFLKNQRQWAAKPLVADEVRAFGAARRATAIRHVFAHSSYLINLGNPDPALWSQAVAVFTDELERAEARDVVTAGFELRTGADYRRASAEGEAAVVRRRVIAFGLNGAKAPVGAGLDRYENVGRGLLGPVPFGVLRNDRRFARVPKA